MYWFLFLKQCFKISKASNRIPVSTLFGKMIYTALSLSCDETLSASEGKDEPGEFYLIEGEEDMDDGDVEVESVIEQQYGPKTREKWTERIEGRIQ